MSNEVDKLEHRLYGNGQPGDIGKIGERIDDVERRLRVLEEFRWKALTIGVLLCFVSGGGRLSLDGILKMMGGQ